MWIIRYERNHCAEQAAEPRRGAAGERLCRIRPRIFNSRYLDRLEEMQELAKSLEQRWDTKLEAVREQRILKFDSRALIALGAIVLSIAGYVIQDARKHREARQ